MIKLKQKEKDGLLWCAANLFYKSLTASKCNHFRMAKSVIEKTNFGELSPLLVNQKDSRE